MIAIGLLGRGSVVKAVADLDPKGADVKVGMLGVVFEETNYYKDGAGPIVRWFAGGVCNVYDGGVVPLAITGVTGGQMYEEDYLFWFKNGIVKYEGRGCSHDAVAHFEGEDLMERMGKGERFDGDHSMWPGGAEFRLMVQNKVHVSMLREFVVKHRSGVTTVTPVELVPEYKIKVDLTIDGQKV